MLTRMHTQSFLSFSLSLSHTHTHTPAHTLSLCSFTIYFSSYVQKVANPFQTFFRSCSLSLSTSWNVKIWLVCIVFFMSYFLIELPPTPPWNLVSLLPPSLSCCMFQPTFGCFTLQPLVRSKYAFSCFLHVSLWNMVT